MSAREPRPAIPEDVKREVRERCGFGCVLCGAPIYQYDHMHEWSKGGAHEPDNLTLLCASHHEEKTKNLLPIERVRRANGNPFNRPKVESPAHVLHYYGDSFEVFMGSTQFTQRLGLAGVCTLVEVNSEPLLSFRIDQGGLLVSLKLCGRDGSPLVTIVDNELTYATASWDVQFKGRALTVREGKGKIRARLAFDPPRRLNLQRALFAHDGLQVEVDPNGIHVPDHNIHLGGGLWDGFYTKGVVAYDKRHKVDGCEGAFLCMPVDE
ncbi:HNH endonuclease [Streptomyces sp. NPDC007088]|uniref:HNH endonuclease n=1 Tax=Streptomyces sp. NPDC007088 TaxID=3364773 RepID=UPI00369C3035